VGSKWSSWWALVEKPGGVKEVTTAGSHRFSNRSREKMAPPARSGGQLGAGLAFPGGTGTNSDNLDLWA